MKKSFVFAWLSTFVVMSVADILWHTLILGQFYGHALAEVARTANGAPQPLIPYFLVGDLIFAFILTFYMPVPAGDNSSKNLMIRGMVLGGLMTMHYTVVNHAVLGGWPASTILPDTIYGILIGTLASFITGYFVRKAIAKTPQGV